VLLKIKPLIVFVRDHHQETYVELTNLYSEVLDQIYYTMLRQYFKDTTKLVQEKIQRQDLLFSANEKQREENEGAI